MPVETRRNPVQPSLFSVVHPLDQPFQSPKTMMNPKLLVCILAFAACGLLSSADAADDGKIRFNFTISLPYDEIDAVSVDDLPNLPPDYRKAICHSKLIRVVHAYRNMENITESDFSQLCKNLTEVDKFYANVGSDSTLMDGFLENVFMRPYECNKPIFKTVLRLCKLTYEDAMETRNCYDNAVMQFSGSADEAACRQKCCHDPSTFNASEPMLCGPERDILASGHCPKPVLDQTLKDNACQTSCAMDALTRYARNFCSYDALPLFMAYGKETLIKYLTMEKCFDTCSAFD